MLPHILRGHMSRCEGTPAKPTGPQMTCRALQLGLLHLHLLDHCLQIALVSHERRGVSPCLSDIGLVFGFERVELLLQALSIGFVLVRGGLGVLQGPSEALDFGFEFCLGGLNS